MKRVAVILLNWNGGHLTIPCIQSLEKSSYPPQRVIVVDNGSSDGSPDEIASRFPDVRIIRNSDNRGFAEGNNIGIDEALHEGTDFVLILNNDTLVHPDMISELVRVAFENEHAAALCPKIYWYDHPDRFWFAGSWTNLWTGGARHLGVHQVDRGQYERISEIGFATGCCLLIPRKCLATVGKFDPKFFIYCEDLDWSLRCRRAGFRLLYVPMAKMWHLESGTTRKMTAWKRYLFTRNLIWTIRRNGTPLQKVSFLFLFYPMRALRRIILMALRRDGKGIRAELRGAREGFFSPVETAKQLADKPVSAAMRLRDDTHAGSSVYTAE